MPRACNCRHEIANCSNLAVAWENTGGGGNRLTTTNASRGKSKK
jgi:hypothetical protein